MIAALLLIQTAAAQPRPDVDCSHKLCLRGHRLTALPDYRWRCTATRGGSFTLAIAGPPAVHERKGRIVPEGLKLPAGIADNRYAPYAIDIGNRTSITENFVANDGKANYFLTVSIKLDGLLDSPTGEQDLIVRGASFQITRGEPDRMAKPFAEGECTTMDILSL